MECIRKQTYSGRRGTVPCPTQGCVHRRFSIDGNSFIAEEASEVDCLLQLRLRVGDSEDPRRPHIIRGKVWSDNVGDYVEREFTLTDAQYELVRNHGARFSIISEDVAGLVNWEEGV